MAAQAVSETEVYIGGGIVQPTDIDGQWKRCRRQIDAHTATHTYVHPHASCHEFVCAALMLTPACVCVFVHLFLVRCRLPHH